MNINKIIKNKKVIAIIILFILFPVFSPSILAASGDPSESPVRSINDVLQILNNIVGWVYRIFFVVAALFIIFAAYSYLTAQGNPETIQKVNKQILYAVIAIIVALLSLSFDVIIANFLKNSQ